MSDDGQKYKIKEIEFMTAIDWWSVLSKIKNQEAYICTFGRPNPDFYNYLKQMNNLTLVYGVEPNNKYDWFIESMVKKSNPSIKLYIKKNTQGVTGDGSR